MLEPILAARLHRAEHRPPDRMAGFGGLEFQLGVGVQRLAEFIPAGPLAAGGAMDERQVLVRIRPFLLGEPFVDGALEGLRRLVVVARLVLLHRQLERRRRALQRAEHRAPGRMAGLRRSELELRVDGQRLAELLAAGPLAAHGAVNEGEVLVRVGALAVGQAEVDGALQVARCLGVPAVLVLAQAARERAGALGGLENVRDPQVVPDGRVGTAREGEETNDGQRRKSHRKRCRIFTASPAFTSTRSTRAGKVELRISMVCMPGATSSTRSGGLTPRRLPSTSTSPQGATASSRRPAPAGTGGSFSVLSRRASFFVGAPSLFGCATGAVAAGPLAPGARAAGSGGSSRARAPTPPPTMTKSRTPATASAERRKPSGPLRASQPGGGSPSRLWVTVSARRRPAGVPPTTE